MSNPIRVLIADDHPIFRHGDSGRSSNKRLELVVVEEARGWRNGLAGSYRAWRRRGLPYARH